MLFSVSVSGPWSKNNPFMWGGHLRKCKIQGGGPQSPKLLVQVGRREVVARRTDGREGAGQEGGREGGSGKGGGRAEF